MRPSTIIRGLLIIAIGTSIIYRIVDTVDHFFIADVVSFVVWLSIAVIIYPIVIFKDWNEFKNGGDRWSFAPTLLGLIFIAAAITQNYLLELRDKSPTVLIGDTPPDFNGVSIRFKADSTYLLTEGSGLGADNFRGTYKWRDSTIVLDRNQFENSKAIESNLLRVRLHDSQIVQIDSYGNVLNRALVFDIH